MNPLNRRLNFFLLPTGIGNHLHIYNQSNHQLLTKFCIFNGQKIHGIQFNDERIIIYGGRLVSIADYDSVNIFQKFQLQTYPDWILDATFIPEEILIVSAHNRTLARSSKNFSESWERECEINSILYCATIVKRESEVLIVAGTVFSEILVWRPKESSQILFRLQGHQVR